MNVHCPEEQSASTIRTGSIVLDRDNRAASVEGQTVRLSRKEYEILELLSLRKGTTLTKEMLLDHLYGGRDEPEQKIIDVFVCKLRKKLVQATGGEHYIETLGGAATCCTIRRRLPRCLHPFRKATQDAMTIAAVERTAA